MGSLLWLGPHTPVIKGHMLAIRPTWPKVGGQEFKRLILCRRLKDSWFQNESSAFCSRQIKEVSCPNCLVELDRLMEQGVNEVASTQLQIECHYVRFTRFAFPLVRRVFHSLSANQIVNVQPMSAGAGIMLIDYLYRPQVPVHFIETSFVLTPANIARGS